MADPTKLDIGDWFSVVGTAIAAGIVAGITSAMGWFSGSKRRIHSRLNSVEVAMKVWDSKHAGHATDLAVLKTCQENTMERLDMISETTNDTNRKLDRLIEKFVEPRG